MKKVILGTGMLISGIIGVVGIIIAVVVSGTLNGEWFRAVGNQGLIVPFFVFIVLAVFGLITSIIGVMEKNRN